MRKQTARRTGGSSHCCQFTPHSPLVISSLPSSCHLILDFAPLFYGLLLIWNPLLLRWPHRIHTWQKHILVPFSLGPSSSGSLGHGDFVPHSLSSWCFAGVDPSRPRLPGCLHCILLSLVHQVCALHFTVGIRTTKKAVLSWQLYIPHDQERCRENTKWKNLA